MLSVQIKCPILNLKMYWITQKWTQSSYNGLSFKKQLDNTQKFKGEVLIAFNYGDPVGFLGYSKTLLPTLWGAISDVDNIKTQKEMINDLLFHFNEINGFDDVVLQMNSRHIALGV